MDFVNRDWTRGLSDFYTRRPHFCRGGHDSIFRKSEDNQTVHGTVIGRLTVLGLRDVGFSAARLRCTFRSYAAAFDVSAKIDARWEAITKVRPLEGGVAIKTIRYRERRNRQIKCTCEAYPFPHQPGGGFCRCPDAPIVKTEKVRDSCAFSRHGIGLRVRK